MRRLFLLMLCLPLVLNLNFDFASPLYLDPHPDSPVNLPPVPNPSLSHFDPLSTDFNDYLWPTVAGRIVTSTFGEYRRSHFHGGIDISSGDMTGYKVFSTRDGYVSRVSISATGYGKMLQVRHADGYTSVYAHLEKFSPAVEARARFEQLRRGTYTMELACGPGELSVRRGEVIAFSGETGTGSPHLHFEVRDNHMNPLNPFFAPDLRVDDHIPPTIRRISISPVPPDAMVNGRAEPKIFSVRGAGKNAYRVTEPIVITGEAGFGVDARDRIPGSRFLNGVYANTLTIDGKPFYAVHLDRTPWREAHEIGIYYDLALLDEGRGHFEKLYMETPNDLPFYSPPGVPSGIVSGTTLSFGKHEFSITCADYNGNTAEVTGALIITRLPGFTATRTDGGLQIRLFEPADVKRVFIGTRSFNSGWSERVWTPRENEGTTRIPLPSSNVDILRVVAENKEGVLSPPLIDCLPGVTGFLAPLALSCEQIDGIVYVKISSNGIITSPPKISVYEGDNRFSALPVAVDAGKYHAWFRPGTGYTGIRRVVAEARVNGHPAQANAELDFYPILPGVSGAISLDAGMLTIAYDSASVRTPLFLTLAKGWEPDGMVYHLGPDRVVLRDGLTVTLKDTSKYPRRGLFARTRGSWEYIGGVNGDRLSGRLPRWLGDLTILEDNVPPTLSSVSVTGTGARMPKIRFRFGDDLSGVEYDELKVYIDDHIVIPEVDGEHHRAVYQAPEPLTRGSHQLTIQLKDRLGNSTRAERQFVLR